MQTVYITQNYAYVSAMECQNGYHLERNIGDMYLDFEDIPTPLPLFPGGDSGDMTRMPFDGEFAPIEPMKADEVDKNPKESGSGDESPENDNNGASENDKVDENYDGQNGNDYGEQNDEGSDKQDTRSKVDKALAIALSKQYVTAARALETDGKILIAVLTKPFYLKSERDLARSALEKEEETLLGADVAVVFDLTIFRAMADNLPDGEKRALYDEALDIIS